MEVLFLGTGNAFASGGRNHMAILLRTEELGVLLDCGPTTLAALKKAAILPGVIDLVLLSHHHGDHFGGIPFIVLHERFQGARLRPLHVFGPPGTTATVTKATTLFFPGIEPLTFPLVHRDLEGGEPVDFGKLRITPFEVDHYSNGTAFGYRVELGGRTIVFSGDTAWCEELSRQSEDCDLFICECSSFEVPLDRHMRHADLVANRERLKARKILLVHAGEDVLSREHELAFDLAHDGMKVSL